MTTQELEYLVKVNDRDLTELRGRVRDVNKTLGSDVEKSSSRGAAGLGKLGHAAGLAALGFAGAGIVSIAGAAKIGFDEFEQGQKVSAQTAAVLKSTGGAAHVTASEVSNLAGALLKKTGIDDETIASGENLLLTFTNIRNEVGKGNDIFTRATKTVLDMSTALGQDTKSSAIQLGKALNDPIKGLTALRRVGVDFTQGQQDAIKAMVASGDTMGAQKAILAELDKEFGGSAEAAGKTLPGQLNVLKETLRNVAGGIVGETVPALSAMLAGLVNNLPAIEATVSKVEARLMPVLRAWWGVVHDDLLPVIQELRSIFTASVEAIAAMLERHKPELTQIWQNVRVLLDGIADVLQTVVLPILKVALEEVLPKAIGIALPIVAKLSDAFKLVGDAVKLVSGGIGDAGGALHGFSDFASGAWSKVQAALSKPITVAAGVFRAFAGVIQEILNLLDAIGSKADAIAGKVGSILGKAKGLLGHIPGFAEGVTGYRGGLAIVGENGPELVRLPSGSDVIPNGRLNATLNKLARSSSPSSGGLFAGATIIVRDELDAAMVAGAVSLRLATVQT